MRAFLDRALGLADRGSRNAALGGGLLILAAAVLVSVDVVLRKLVSVTVGGADELSGYALAIGSAWSFAFVLLNRGNVRIDALYQHLPRVLAAVCDMLAILSLLAFVSLVTWHGSSVLAHSWNVGARSNSSLAVPLIVPQALWWAGYAWFVVCGLLLLLRGTMAFVGADWNDVNRLLGARTIEEEAADELSNAVRSLGAGKP